MEPRVARGIARRGHRGQRDRFGGPVIEHVARVAEAVPVWARNTAWLHDLFELTPISALELRARGVSPVECQALLAQSAEPAGLVPARAG